MKLMIDGSPYLSSITDYSKVAKSIEVVDGPMLGNVYEALSSDADSALGRDVHACIYDEILVGSEELWDNLATAQGSRRQPMFIGISTAGPYDPNSLLHKQYAYAKQVLAGTIVAPTYLPCIYEASSDDPWDAIDTWKKANPALSDFRSLEDMEKACAKAKAIPSKQNTFKMFFLNLFQEAASVWMTAATWQSVEADFTRESLRGRKCEIGVDLATVGDLAACVCVFPKPSGTGVDVLPFLFTPADKLQEHAEKYKQPYGDWVRDGFLIATPGKTVNYKYIRALINELGQEFDVQHITYDRWNSSHLISELEEDGFTCVPLGQGIASMNAPMKLAETWVIDGTLQHDGNPVMTWCVASTMQTTDAQGNVKPDKAKSTGGKIDGVCAMLNALDTASRHLRAESLQVYVF